MRYSWKWQIDIACFVQKPKDIHLIMYCMWERIAAKPHSAWSKKGRANYLIFSLSSNDSSTKEVLSARYQCVMFHVMKDL